MGATANMMAVVGMVSQTAGAYTNAQNAQRVNRMNAQIADMHATDALRRGKNEEFAHRQKVQQLKSSQRASFASRGVALDEGSPLAVLVSTDYMGEVDAATIRENASREAWGYRVGASNYRAAANARSPLLEAGNTLLTGAGSVASKWYQLNEKGA